MNDYIRKDNKKIVEEQELIDSKGNEFEDNDYKLQVNVQ